MRADRGAVRGLLLSALLEGPAHGYELIRQLETTSGGRWSPSPGSVYPALNQLEDEGLVTASLHGDKKIYTLTDAGRPLAESATLHAKPWEQPTGPDDTRYPLRDITHAVHAAAKQVGAEGSPDQIAKAIEIMRATRQQLYRLLADD